MQSPVQEIEPLPVLNTSALTAHWHEPRAVTPEFVDRWRDLLKRSCVPNAFLAPDFVLPAQRWFPEVAGTKLFSVSEGTGGRLLLLGAFESAAPSRVCCFPHLVAGGTPFTFRTNMLLDEERWADALSVALASLRRDGRWQAIRFPRLRMDGLLAKRLRSVLQAADLELLVESRTKSPAVFPLIRTGNLEELLSASRRKSLRRSRNALEAVGPIRFEEIRDRDRLPRAIEQFLELEQSGWKGAAGTAMGAHEATTSFLKDFSEGMFAHGGLLLTQLWAGDRLAASAINLRCGPSVYAFKIGWNQELAKGSPGAIHELELVAHVQRHDPDITLIDGCAKPDSYLSHLWPDDLPIGSVVVPLSKFVDLTSSWLQSVRRVLGKFRGELTRPGTRPLDEQ
ncbi:MAG: GNAT family N-acetyltransferase [Planctomycetaceae bacterium]|nr:GNAT family N-acetyltransferase [Planctomycetaceae bacterium]